MKELFIRAISGLLIVLLSIFIISKGGSLLAYFIFLLSLIGIREFYRAVENIKIKPVKIIGYISCVGFLLNALGIKWVSVSLILFFAVAALLTTLVFKKDIKLLDIAMTLFGIFYIPFLMQHIIYLDGSIYIWLIFITAWGTDTMAYLSGSIFGKNKLCPQISPKKTIEGSIGGILGSVLLTLAYGIYYQLSPIWFFLLLSFVASIIAQIGDLIASKLKRITGIKDFGFIMPGHGGILDRFDSILFTAPLIYYMVNLL
ncbi:MAG: phosphatidate cytidylyltransferase [Tissierellia bacterium]|nr:phosphatidate cytidylyltransferase [Tissierellia bacterium]